MAFLTGTTFKLLRWFSLTECPSTKDNPELILTMDMMIVWLKSAQSEYFVEAKHIWIDLNQPDAVSAIPLSITAVTRAAQQICVELLATTFSANVHRVALVFCRLRYIQYPALLVSDAL
jgi:hypothetical protein